MLQRKQTLWMLLALICAALTFNFPFYQGNVTVGQYGHELRGLTAWPHYINGSSGSILITLITIVLIVGIGWNIFNYKNRKRQLWVTIGLIVFSLLNIAVYFFHSGRPDFTEGGFSLTALIAIAIPVFLIMAARGIRKDDKLVKSADRLR
jgi:peptidoglycan/LPS O-acetylase OafA/YrhL